MNRLILTIASLVLLASGLSSGLTLGTDVTSWPITSLGANSKLVLTKDLIVPANKDFTSLWGDAEEDFLEKKFFHCHISLREMSLNSRVLRAGTAIFFTGEVNESVHSAGDKGNFNRYVFQISQPEAVERVFCDTFSYYEGENVKIKPREATLGDLIRFLKGASELVLTEPLEIVNP